MARVKRAVNAHKKRRSTLEAASGYRGQRSRLYRKANEQLIHSATYSYRDRKARKGDFRQLWITRINAAARANNMTYNRFIQGLRAGRSVTADRKALTRSGRQRRHRVQRAGRSCPGGRRGRGHRRRRVTNAGGLSASAHSASRTPDQRPLTSAVLADSNARLAAARRLTSRKQRRETRSDFPPKGPRRFAEALQLPASSSSCSPPPRPIERNSGTARRPARSTRSARQAAAAIVGDRHTAGRHRRLPGRGRRRRLASVLGTPRRGWSRLLVEPNDPGNLGTIIRTADAATGPTR